MNNWNKVVETYNYYVYSEDTTQKNIVQDNNKDDNKEENKDKNINVQENLIINEPHDNNYCHININENNEIEHGHDESPIKYRSLEFTKNDKENKDDEDDEENKDEDDKKEHIEDDKKECIEVEEENTIKYGNNLSELEVEYSDIHLNDDILFNVTSRRLLFFTSIAAVALYGIIKKK